MKDSQRKYLQRCIKSRILGNRLEMKSRCKGQVYQMIDRIVNDYRFFCVLDFRREWIVYATTRIEALVDLAGVDKMADDSGWLGLSNDFVQRWFDEHFGKDVAFVPENSGKSVKPQIMTKSVQKEDDDDDYDEGKDDGLPFKIKSYKYSGDLMAADNTAIDEKSDDMNTNQPGKGEGEDHDTDEQFLKSIDPSIVDLAMKLGRVGESMMFDSQSQFTHASRSDISGVTVGDNLNAMLPVETALLGDRATENVFFRRFVEKRLQVFASASVSTQNGKVKKGPIIMCVDTSGSMMGEPEKMAKMLAQAVAIVAQRTHRTLCVINYSAVLQYFVLTNWTRQRKSFLKFLSKSNSGANNENLMFSFLFKSLLKGRKYAHLKDRVAGADLLVISDYQWSYIAGNVTELLDEAKASGMKFYSLEIGNFDWIPQCDFGFGGSYSYLSRCECRHLFKNGRCVEYKPE